MSTTTLCALVLLAVSFMSSTKGDVVQAVPGGSSNVDVGVVQPSPPVAPVGGIPPVGGLPPGLPGYGYPPVFLPPYGKSTTKNE